MINKNPQKICSMFNEIACIYDKINNFLSFNMHYFIKISSVKFLNIRQPSKILDLCTGTGDFVKIISKLHPDSDTTGLDISSNMLEIAKRKNPGKKFILADCTNLPYKDNEFDYITAGFGLRNIENRAEALNQIYRTLKNNGWFLHLDFGDHNFFSFIFNLIASVLILFLKDNREHYKYLIASKNEYPVPDELIKEFEQCGFKNFKTKYYLFGVICAICAQK